MFLVIKRPYVICTKIPKNESIKKVEETFYFNNKKIAPKVPKNTATANAAVTQEGTS